MMGGGRHRVESLLGRGGMGSVYAVTDVVRGTPLALKRLNEPASSAAAAASLHREYTRRAGSRPRRPGSERSARCVDRQGDQDQR